MAVIWRSFIGEPSCTARLASAASGVPTAKYMPKAIAGIAIVTTAAATHGRRARRQAPGPGSVGPRGRPRAIHELGEGLVARVGRQRAVGDVGLDLAPLAAQHFEVGLGDAGAGGRARTQQGNEHEGERHGGHERGQEPEDKHRGGARSL